MTLKSSSQHLLLFLVLLVCFGAFYTYYQPNMNWLTCSGVSTEDISDNCSDQIQKFIQNFNKSSKNQVKLTIVLIWTWPFGQPFEKNSCSMYGIEGCYITDNKQNYYKAHGIMFHHNDINDIASLQQKERPHMQKWVWMNMESPSNSYLLTGADNLFNLTASYRRDSDIWVPYGKIVEASEEDKAFKIPPKNKQVCWMVNNWNHKFRRVKYYYELIKHINVEVYGKAFGKYVSDEDYITTLSSCKFYLAFENSIHKDYFTEKLFNPLLVGAVPIVLGPPRENYEEFIPADSFIHVDDFESPQKLAQHLIFLDQNQEMYKEYFNWRKLYTAKGTLFGLEHACRICDHVRSHNGYKVFRNLNKWYWS